MIRIVIVYIAYFISFCGVKAQTSFKAALEKATNSTEDSVQYHFRVALDAVKTPEDKAAYLYARMVHFSDLAELDSTEIYGLEAEELYQNLRDSAMLNRIYYELMTINQNKGILEKALNYNLLAYDINEHLKDTVQMIRTLFHRSVIHHDFEEYREGIRIGKRGLTLLDQFSEALNIYYLHIKNGIAINYDDWDKPDSALFYYRQIVSQNYDEGDEIAVARIYNNMGNTYLKIENLPLAKECLIKSFNTHRKYRDSYELSTVTNNLGRVHKYFRNFDSAEWYLKNALAYADSSSSIEKKRDAYFNLAALYEELGDLSRAMEYQDLYYAIRDSIFNKERAQAIASLEVTYKTARKDQEIVLLNKENELKSSIIERNTYLISGLIMAIAVIILLFYLWRLKQSSIQKAILQEQKIRMREAQIKSVIQSQEQERQRFASDLHDGIGQLINAIKLNIDGLRIKKNGTSEERVALYENSGKLLSEMNNEIRNIAFNLMPQILIKEGIIAALTELARRINSSGQMKIDIQNQGIEGRLSEIIEISAYRIIQELISNVIKYANAKNIFIQFTVEPEQEITITIEDDGIGYDVENFKNGKGDGWKNINSRLSLIKAEMTIDTVAERKGSTVIIDIPLNNSITHNEVELKKEIEP